MATKTLILRPVRVTTDDESLVTLYPSNTTMANAHTLVSEEVADDDATYIWLTGAKGAVRYYFEYTKPEDLISITNFTVTLKEKLESGSNVGGYNFYINNTMQAIGGSITLNTSEYNFYTLSPNTDKALTSIINLFSEATSDTEIYFYRNVNSNSSKASPLKTTQVYMEITYEAKEEAKPDLIYLKKDNIYTQVNYNSIYSKNNNSWVITDISSLQNNEKYIIKEVE